MFNSPFNKAVLSTLAAAIVATGLSFSPAMAGEGGGGGIDRGFRPSVGKPYNPKASQHVNAARAARYIAMRQRIEAGQRSVADAPARNPNSNR